MTSRCKSCNDILNPEEMRSKHHETNDYIDICFNCFTKARLAEEGYYDKEYWVMNKPSTKYRE